MDLLKIDLNIDKYLLGSILCIENVITISGLSCVFFFFAWNVNSNVQYFNLQYFFFLKDIKIFRCYIFRHFVWFA